MAEKRVLFEAINLNNSTFVLDLPKDIVPTKIIKLKERVPMLSELHLEIKKLKR